MLQLYKIKIYLSKEIVCEEFGYKQSKHMMNNFYSKMLYKHFKIDIDYKEFVETDLKAVFPREDRFIPVNGGQNRKEYLITPRCYKRILMTVKTEKGDQIRDYYENIEELCKLIFKIIDSIKERLYTEKIYTKDNELSLSLQQLSIKDSIINETNDKLQLEQRKNVALTNYNKDLLNYKLQTEKNEYIYIASTKDYAKQGIFKIGRTKELKQRLSQHNSSHINEDGFTYIKTYKVNDSTSLEHYIHKKLRPLRKDNECEFYLCVYEYLEKIVDKLVESDETAIEMINLTIQCLSRIHSLDDSTPLDKGLDYDIFIDINDDELYIDIKVNIDIKIRKDKIINIYNKFIESKPDVVSWLSFQIFLKQFIKPKSYYKSREWRVLCTDALKTIDIDLK